MRQYSLVNACRLLIIFVIVTNTMATHFRGGTISWKSLGGKKVEFFFKMGWTYEDGPGCTEQKIGQFVNGRLLKGIGDTFEWICVEGCKGKPVVHSPSYYCMAANKDEGWEQGQMTFDYTFQDDGPFRIAFDGTDWMKLGNNKGGGRWSISTTVDLRTRSDTKKINTSPVTLSQAMYYQQYDCHHELRIPVLDADGDKVLCQWAVGQECEAVCDALPEAHLNEETCTVTFESTSAKKYEKDTFYAVALTIRDYPQTTITLGGKDKKTPTDGLSSIPLQFLIKTPEFKVGCNEKPRFVNPTPAEGKKLLYQARDLVNIKVAADNTLDYQKKIVLIDVIGPVGLHQSKLTQDKSRKNTFQKTLTWSTSASVIGDHIVCAKAENERKKTGDPRCFTIEIVPDPCDSSPCQMGGKCHSRLGKITGCVCVPGFTGTYCEINIDECQTDPCQNGATCHDQINDYACTCVPGYTDKNCSTDIDDCQIDPCENGGTCHDMVNDYNCTCVPGYTDKTCSTDIDECQTDPCKNGAVCHDLINDYNCTCKPGFTDKNCSTDIDDCETDPCKNGGVCHDQVNDYVCTCEPGFTDKNCSTDIDDCLSDPCMHEGNCTDQVNDFICKCIPGYSGKNCHIGVDFCKIKPCENGGICHNGLSGFTCQCVNGWEGKICDYRSAISKRSSCTQKKNGVATSMMVGARQNKCCQENEYSKCQCFLAPNVKPKVIGMDQATRDLLCALIGFPIGLGLSFLTFALIRRCSTNFGAKETFQSYRAKHPPSKLSTNRTQIWINDQMVPVETASEGRGTPSRRINTASSRHRNNSEDIDGAYHDTPPPPTYSSLLVTPMNTYRASFNDESMHRTAAKKNPDDASGRGATDWGYGKAPKFNGKRQLTNGTTSCRRNSSSGIADSASPSPSLGESMTHRNIYRASFNDESMHRTAGKKSLNTYSGGGADRGNGDTSDGKGRVSITTKPTNDTTSRRRSSSLDSHDISSPSSTAGQSVTPTNIYRASFNDEGMHRTAAKKNSDTYSGGAADWGNAKGNVRASPQSTKDTASSRPSNPMVIEDIASPSPSYEKSMTPRNIYRASFNDDNMHRTASKKSLDTYNGGAADWGNAKENVRASTQPTNDTTSNQPRNPMLIEDIASPSPSYEKSMIHRNIYRASFNDESMHRTALKKNSDTYSDGATDWGNGNENSPLSTVPTINTPARHLNSSDAVDEVSRDTAPPTAAGSGHLVMPTNIYRASFNDESMHRTGERRNLDTYSGGAADWSA